MRKVRGWGHGFEQTFLVDDSIETAAARGIAEGLLSRDEANTERDILLHFSPKLEPLLRKCQTDIARLEQQLESEQVKLAPVPVRPFLLVIPQYLPQILPQLLFGLAAAGSNRGCLSAR